MAYNTARTNLQAMIPSLKVKFLKLHKLRLYPVQIMVFRGPRLYALNI